MKNLSRHTGELRLIERLNNSQNGNPRYLLSCGGFSFRTKPDSSLAYKVPNYFGKNVTVTVGTYYGRAHLDSIVEAE